MPTARSPAQRRELGLRRDSETFARLWTQHGVLGREGGERTFDHPRDGVVRFTHVTFNLASEPELKLTILAQSNDRRK